MVVVGGWSVWEGGGSLGVAEHPRRVLSADDHQLPGPWEPLVRGGAQRCWEGVVERRRWWQAAALRAAWAVPLF